MEGPAGTSITYVQNLCSDFIAAGGGQIVIPQHFSRQRSNFLLYQIPFFADDFLLYQFPFYCYIRIRYIRFRYSNFLFSVISDSVSSDSVTSISFFWLYQFPLHQSPLYQFPFFVTSDSVISIS